MALVGEEVFWGQAAWAGGPFTATASFELPPSNALAKVSPPFTMSYDNGDMVSAGIMSIRRRLPDGSDELVETGNVPAVGDGNLTNVTLSFTIYNCQAAWFLDIGFWG